MNICQFINDRFVSSFNKFHSDETLRTPWGKSDILDCHKIVYQIFTSTWLCKWSGFDNAVGQSTGKTPVKSNNKNTDLHISRFKYVVSKWVPCHKLLWFYQNIILFHIFSSWHQVKSLVNMPLPIEILRLSRFCGSPIQIWPSCCFFVPSEASLAALGTKKQQEGQIWIGLILRGRVWDPEIKIWRRWGHIFLLNEIRLHL